METDTPRPAPAPVAGIEVEISDTQSHLDVDPRRLHDVVRRTLALEGVEAGSISVALVDDAAIRVINARHLGHDWPTDVISFGLSDPGDPELSGELVVSAEMAAATARAVGAEPFAELALYVVHGLLHLCGHDDRTSEDAASIRAREGEVLAELGLVNTFPLACGPEVEAGAAAEPVGEDPSRGAVRWMR